MDGRWAITTVTTRGLAGDDLVAGAENVAAVLSPDRRTVLYLRKEGDGRNTLHAVSADGRTDVKLFSDGSTDCPRLRRPALGPDDMLALVCAGFDAGDEDTLTIMSLSGDVVDQLDKGQLGDPTFSPDGGTLVYARSTDEPYIYGGDLFSTAVDGSGSPRQLVRGSNLNPVWQPDGHEVAFVSIDDDDTKHLNLVQVPDNGSEASRPRRLSEVDEYDQDPSWSPDGTRLAFRRGRTEPHLFVFDDQGEGDREVVRDDGTASAPVWTAR